MASVPLFNAAAPTVQDAQSVADTIHEHVRHTSAPHYEALRKSIKALIKEGSEDAKSAMRCEQKKLQAACGTTKKKLQEECTEKKRALYKEYLASRSAQEQEHHAALAKLQGAQRIALRHATTLQSTFDNALAYLQALKAEATRYESSSIAKAIAKEEEWLETLDKTSRKAGVPFDAKLKKEAKKKKEKGAGRHNTHK